MASGRALELDSQATRESQNTYLREENRIVTIEQAKEVRLNVREEAMPAEDLIFKQGGWISSAYRYYKNIDNQDSKEDYLKWSWHQDAYFWLYWNYQSTHTVYIQFNDAYVNQGIGADYTGTRSDNDGPHLSMAYTQINLGRRYDTPVSVTFGRQYFSVGRGIAYAAIHDGLLTETSVQPFYIKGLLAKAKPREDNIDYSVPGFNKEGDRIFTGAEIAYAGNPDHSLYGFGLYSKDLSSSNPENPRQNYHVNSFYLGTGISSKLFKNFELWSEWISEGGTGFTDSSRVPLGKTNVKAWGMVSGAKYRFELPTHPVLEASFAHGSGDGDRTNVTNTTGGDLDGRDSNFLYYGYYQAGYAFQPRLSNINIAELGASFKPLEYFKPFEQLALGAKYYFYWKDKADGGTSDTESTGNDGDLGREFNVFLHWKIYENCTLSTRYGIFFPGMAFPETTRDNTQYFYNSLTMSF